MRGTPQASPAGPSAGTSQGSLFADKHMRGVGGSDGAGDDAGGGSGGCDAAGSDERPDAAGCTASTRAGGSDAAGGITSTC